MGMYAISKSDKKIKYYTCLLQKVLLHKFPEEAKMQSAWIAACDTNNINVKTSHICEKHFSEKSYKHDLVNELLGRPLRKLLKWDAIPTIKVPFVITAMKVAFS